MDNVQHATLEYKPDLDLRDYFAAHALNGILASCVNGDVVNYEYVIRTAFRIADAMMQSRESVNLDKISALLSPAERVDE